VAQRLDLQPVNVNLIPPHLLKDADRAFVKPLGLSVLALILMDRGQGVEHIGDVGVIGANRLLKAGKRPRCQDLGLRKLIMGEIVNRPVMELHGQRNLIEVWRWLCG
jgi:hypothetical protein